MKVECSWCNRRPYNGEDVADWLICTELGGVPNAPVLVVHVSCDSAKCAAVSEKDPRVWRRMLRGV